MVQQYSRREALRVVLGSAFASALPSCQPKHPANEPERQMRPLRIQNEFGTLRTALVHDASNAVNMSLEELQRAIPAAELKDHPETGASLKNQLIAQHAKFRDILTEHGVKLVSPETQPNAFCQVFTRDPCFVIGDTLFVASLRDPYRHSETLGLTQLRTEVQSVVDLGVDGSLIEGGDVMVIDAGRRVLVGMNRHTNEVGVSKLAIALGKSVEVVRIPHRALHLDCCVAPLPNGESLYCKSKLTAAGVNVLRRHFKRLIEVEQKEGELNLAANLFWINERTVVSSSATKETNKLLREKGYTVIELDFSQLVSLWGSFRCVVCPLERG